LAIDDTVLTINPDDIDIADYITSSHHIDLLHKNYAAIGHNSDFITVAVTQKGADHLKVPLDKIVVRFNFKRTKDGVVKVDNNLDFDSRTAPVTVTNDEEKGGADVNVYVSIVEVSIKEGQTVNPSGGQASVRTDGDKAGTDYTPYIIGIIILVVAAALIYWFFLRGKTVFGHTFGAPEAVAAAPATPAVVVVPTAAPAPAPAQGAR
jgi:hypothetical protein